MDASEDDPVLGWASEFHDAMAVHATGGVYVNLIADDENDRIPAAYGPNYDRLGGTEEEMGPGQPVQQ